MAANRRSCGRCSRGRNGFGALAQFDVVDSDAGALHRYPEHNGESAMTKYTFVLIATLANAWAQPAIAPPQIGFMLDATGALRPVSGLAGNFLLGAPIAKGVLSAAFSGLAGWMKTDSSLSVFDQQGHVITTSNAGSGPALFAFSSAGQPALAFLTTSSALLEWSAGKFVALPLDPAALAAEAVISIGAPDADHAALLVQRQNALWDIRVSIATGQVDSQSALPNITAPALILAGSGISGIISSDANGVVVYQWNGSQVHIPAHLPNTFAFEQMGDGWIEVRDLANPLAFAVRLGGTRQGFYALPEVNQ